MLGGNASSEIRMHIVGANSGRGVALETEAREGGIIEEIRLATAARNPQRPAAMLDLILYELCREEKNLRLMLDTRVVGCEKSGRLITHALAERGITEDRFRISAKCFIDCTGDGRLGAEAGATFRRGREGRVEFGESMAQPEPDRYSLGSTILFIARRHVQPMPFVAPKWARKFTEADLKFRPHAKPGVDNGLEYGYWWVEWGGHLDTLKDHPMIRDELLAIVMGVWDHIKNGGEHGAENWALDWFGFHPGKRETRRFIGQHVLTENDLMNSVRFEDAIAYGGWPVDTHPHRGVDAVDEHPCSQIPVPYLFDIPLRSCLSKDLDNLMFAGRNISATHIAFASTRVMATCAVVGQGVGTAAAYAVAKGIAPSGLTSDARALRAIRQRLLRDDSYLIGEVNEDDLDLAKTATITASSHQPGAGPEKVVSGQTRSVHGPRGAPADRARPGVHRWMSDPQMGLPATLTLEWSVPVDLRQVRLIFDSGLDRILTLSHSDDYVKLMKWGVPQPELVRDYRLEVKRSAGWESLAETQGNYQRLRIHRLETVQRVNALRVSVLATNGLDHSRICEVRVYGDVASEWYSGERKV